MHGGQIGSTPSAATETDTVTPAELAELIQITDQIEQQDAQRLAALIALAQLRQTTVPVLMDRLGIRLPAHA